MSKEIKVRLDTTGLTLIAELRNAAGQIWNTATPGFESYNSSNIASYAIAMTEQGAAAYYTGDLPAVPNSAQYFASFAYKPAGSGAAHAENDPKIAGQQTIEWGSGVPIALATKVPATLDPADVAGTPTGTVSGTPGSTSFQATGSLSASNGAYANSYLRFEAGSANAGLALPITSYVGSTNTFGFSVAWPVTPLVGDVFVILGSHVP